MRNGTTCVVDMRTLTNTSVYIGNSTFAGATAAIMANVVLIGYVVVAMKEDQSDQAEAKEGKKDR